ncbi:MAG: type I methionyl aminopeptidase [Bacteroidetes bacterium]|nr:MAG: type I methionyl aminopeptidase [Bacteroidota bacterium]
MVYYKTEEEIALIRESCMLVCRTLAHVASLIRPGVTGAELDREAETFIRDHGGVPGFKGYRGFPATLCFSPNEVVVHGIPDDRPIEEGDVVSVDCGVKMNGFYGDAAYTFAVGPVSEEVMHLLRVTNTSLYKGIEQAVAGKRLGDIGHAIQHYVEQEHGYKVVRELVGHGIGKNLHEAPEVPNYGTRGRGMKLKAGLTIAIEPMVNMQRRHVAQADDGWTIFARDRRPSAHYEHTVAVRAGKAELLSDHGPIEEAIAQNAHLQPIGLLEPVR